MAWIAIAANSQGHRLAGGRPIHSANGAAITNSVMRIQACTTSLSSPDFSSAWASEEVTAENSASPSPAAVMASTDQPSSGMARSPTTARS